jgi:hypothetical protein
VREDHEECQSFRSGDLVCKDGFIQTPYCRGYAGCHACGHISDRLVPACLKGEIPERFLTESGLPIFYEARPS